MTAKQKLLMFTLVIGVVLLSGCAAHPNPMVHKAGPDGEVAGFWMGLWHGLIAPIAFVVTLLDGDARVYEVFNNGGWYNFGFMIGIAAWGGGAGKASS